MAIKVCEYVVLASPEEVTWRGCMIGFRHSGGPRAAPPTHHPPCSDMPSHWVYQASRPNRPLAWPSAQEQLRALRSLPDPARISLFRSCDLRTNQARMTGRVTNAGGCGGSVRRYSFVKQAGVSWVMLWREPYWGVAAPLGVRGGEAAASPGTSVDASDVGTRPRTPIGGVCTSSRMVGPLGTE